MGQLLELGHLLVENGIMYPTMSSQIRKVDLAPFMTERVDGRGPEKCKR